MTNQVLRIRGVFRISQERLAEVSGVKQSTISAIERTRRRPNVYTAIRLARALSELAGQPILVEELFPLDERSGASAAGGEERQQFGRRDSEEGVCA